MVHILITCPQKDYNWDMSELQKLPVDPKKTETITILKAENKASKALAELKGIAQVIPNQFILIRAEGLIPRRLRRGMLIEYLFAKMKKIDSKNTEETVKKYECLT